MPMWNKISFQNSNSPTMEHLTFFHDHTLIIILFIVVLTFSSMLLNLKMKKFNQFMLEYNTMEMFWTSIPALMLVFIAFPSLKTLYMMEESMTPVLTIKTTGLQWLWNYEYSNLNNKKITSSMMMSNKMRTMMTSNNLIIPTLIPTRMMISSKDVLHSWTIPSLGVKADAMPGRMNQLMFSIKRPGVLIGQCSEICGAGHSFMPIFLESPSVKNFVNY